MPTFPYYPRRMVVKPPVPGITVLFYRRRLNRAYTIIMKRIVNTVESGDIDILDGSCSPISMKGCIIRQPTHKWGTGPTKILLVLRYRFLMTVSERNPGTAFYWPLAARDSGEGILEPIP